MLRSLRILTLESRWIRTSLRVSTPQRPSQVSISSICQNLPEKLVVWEFGKIWQDFQQTCSEKLVVWEFENLIDQKTKTSKFWLLSRENWWSKWSRLSEKLVVWEFENFLDQKTLKTRKNSWFENSRIWSIRKPKHQSFDFYQGKTDGQNGQDDQKNSLFENSRISLKFLDQKTRKTRKMSSWQSNLVTICSQEFVTRDEFGQNRKSCAALIFWASKVTVESAVT